MSIPTRIFLIGPMGAGKTSVGDKLSLLLGYNFLDADVLMEQKFGLDISEQFNLNGEEYFRYHESLVLESFTHSNNIVFATGGGCILLENNRKLLLERGMVCYLRVRPFEQMRRLISTQDRPLLPRNEEQRLQYLRDMNLTRSPLYESIANFTIDTDGKTVSFLAVAILNMIHRKVCT